MAQTSHLPTSFLKHDGLPRQARDKRAENSTPAFCFFFTQHFDCRSRTDAVIFAIYAIVGSMSTMVGKTPLFVPFIYINGHFTKTGSGQT